MEAGRYLWEIVGFSPLPTAGSAEGVLRTRSTWVLNISEGRDSTASLSNFCHCLTTVTVKVFLFSKHRNGDPLGRSGDSARDLVRQVTKADDCFLFC